MDKLADLPINKNDKALPQELKALEKFFKKGDSQPNNKVSEFKIILIATLLFMALSLDFFVKIIECLPGTDNYIVKYSLKALIYAVTLYVITTFV